MTGSTGVRIPTRPERLARRAQSLLMSTYRHTALPAGIIEPDNFGTQCVGCSRVGKPCRSPWYIQHTNLDIHRGWIHKLTYTSQGRLVWFTRRRHHQGLLCWTGDGGTPPPSSVVGEPHECIFQLGGHHSYCSRHITLLAGSVVACGSPVSSNSPPHIHRQRSTSRRMLRTSVTVCSDHLYAP